MALALTVGGAIGIAWNVVTVSLRQRITPDRLLGRLVTRLKSQGMYDDTLIVVWSDHGFHLAEKRAAARAFFGL